MVQHIRFCTTTDGVQIAYALMGAGTPVVRVVGWLTHLEDEFQFPMWQRWAECLSARHLLIRYDGRGTGLSDREVSDLSLEARVRDLEAVVDATGFARVALIGTSAGGQAAVVYAARHPDRVSRLILVGAWVSTDAEGREFVERLAQMALQGWGLPSPLFRQFFTNMIYPDADTAAVRAFTELERVSASPEVAAAFIVETGAWDVSDLLPQIKAPTLVIHRRGEIRGFDQGRRLAAGIPGARLLPLDGKNHMPLPGEPEFEQMLDAMLAFLAESPAGPNDFPDGLSAREVQVLRLLAAGKSNREIADWLVLSPHTVVRHVSNIFDKTGVASRTEAAVYAARHGLIE